MRFNAGTPRTSAARTLFANRRGAIRVRMDWDDLRHFLALARLGSVRGAGAALGVSHSTVARRVEALEVRLAARLFDRTRDGYSLTEAGRSMLVTAERVEGEVAAIERGIVGTDERLAGPVAITCCDPFVSALLLRELRPFCDDHPGIELRLTTDGRPFDLAKREADLAIRALARGVSPPEHLIGQRVAPLVVCSYVAREHESRFDPEIPGSEPRWVAFDDRRQLDPLVAGGRYPSVPTWGSFSTLDLLVQAATAGFGLVILPTYVGDPNPALRRLTHPDLRHVADLWLLCHPDLRDNARFTAVRARVRAAFERHQPRFVGDGWSTSAPLGPATAPGKEVGARVR